ncbi:hypothetical protein KJ764_05750 [Patescibacteria group bacterium]|nr:hypothetical protein [Patescibacteria group bacterium]
MTQETPDQPAIETVGEGQLDEESLGRLLHQISCDCGSVSNVKLDFSKPGFLDVYVDGNLQGVNLHLFLNQDEARTSHLDRGFHRIDPVG